jgi:hypothetical protein
MKRKFKKKPLKIAIGIPSLDMVPTDFALSLTTMIQYTNIKRPGTHLALINQRGGEIDRNRRKIVDIAQEMNADKILFVDSDMLLPMHALVTLLDHKLPVVGCDYSTRYEENQSFRSTAKGLDGSRNLEIREELFEVGGLGFGCILIDMDVFAEMDKPYFAYVYKSEDHTIPEDYYFCKFAQAGGYKVWCDGKLSQELGHMGMKAFKLGR